MTEIEPEWTEDDENELFASTRLSPSETGLSVFVWPRVQDEDDGKPFLKVATAKTVEDLRTAPKMSISPPALLSGDLSPEIVAEVATWIAAHEAVLIDHWDGRIDSIGLIRGVMGLPDDWPHPPVL